MVDNGQHNMKALISVLALLLVGISASWATVPTSVQERCPLDGSTLVPDTCECVMWVDEANGRWTLYIKNPCDTTVVAECWYLVEFVDGAKDTRTTTITIGPGASTYVDTELLNVARIEEFGSASKPD